MRAFPDPDDPDHVVEVDDEFLSSGWECIWGRGCQGILDEPAEELGQGCCSVGARLLDLDEAMNVAALGAGLDPARFQFAAEAADGGVLTDDRLATRLVDDACIFLNRPGFAAGAGCALHLAAVDAGESPIGWKPAICWQLPLTVDRSTDDEGRRRTTLRPRTRADWGSGGADMAWWCTDAGSGAYSADTPVVDRLAPELEALLGRAVVVELRGGR